ncbi:hypothetical protein DSO57_1028084 [Entomophthora muscae]|uniref:Uncharacterized protein n=2 Tax=Entomophthora muscae TaxID=34485 RepID=A0ACC2SEG0_9FUNG|nr:hypothetical protein DSO57_1028084 [Entomophthora muscae]
MNAAVSKATKHDGNYPKQKHVIALCSFSWESKVTVKNMLDMLADRLHDSNWDVVFKALIVVHCVMRDGCPANVFGYLAHNPGMLHVVSFRPKPGSAGMLQAKNIKAYAGYLENKVQVYQVKGVDFAESRSGRGLRLMNDSVKGGLIENISLIQDHLEVLLNTKYLESDIDNHVTLYSFKMLIRDLLKIFQCVNQGIISILKVYFDLDKDEASVCLALYRRFISQTEQVIAYLDTARNLESLLQFTVPQLKHAPISLLESLEEYIKEPLSVNAPVAAAAPSTQMSKKKDAIDFFASLDDDLAMQNYQPPIPNIRVGSPSVAGSFTGSNPFAPAMAHRSVSPFDAYIPPHQPSFQSSNQNSLMSFQPSLQPSFHTFSQSSYQNNSQPIYQASSQPNPFMQTTPASFGPNFNSLGSHNSNPFGQTQVQQNRNTNPFGANGFANHAPQQSHPASNFGFPHYGNQTAPQNPPHNDLSNLFSQHSFPTQ